MINRTLRTALGALLTVSVLAATTSFASAENTDQHLTTYVKLAGTYASVHGTSWNTVAQYVDYGDIDQRGSEPAHNAGIKVGFYTDVHLICRGNTCSGSPSLDQVPEAALAHSCDGARIYSSDDTDAARKLLGDPTKPELLRTWNKIIDGKLQNQFGRFHEDFVIDDDAFIPKTAYYRWHANSPRGAVQPDPFCGYQTSRYVAAIKSMEAQAHLPVILNGLNAVEDMPYVENAPNVWGGICEDCLHASYDPRRNHEASPFWNEQLDAALTTTAHHKIWVAYPHGNIDADTQGYVYASLMLVYRGRFTALDEDVHTPSGIPLSPTIFLVPHGAVQPVPHMIAQLRRNGGVYAREFSHCTIKGTPVGACATIVNPDPDHAHPYPFAPGKYMHTLRILGQGVASELGDTGALTTNGPQAPQMIAPRGWAIVFQ